MEGPEGPNFLKSGQDTVVFTKKQHLRVSNNTSWLCTHGLTDPEKCTALPNSVALRKQRLKEQILHVNDANRWISKLRRKEAGFQYILQRYKWYEKVWMRAIVSS